MLHMGQVLCEGVRLSDLPVFNFFLFDSVLFMCFTQESPLVPVFIDCVCVYVL